MCICHTGERCPCYRDEAEYQAELERIAEASALEHAVLDLLHDATASASPPARRFVAAIRADPRSLDGAAVADVLVGDGGAIWWTRRGEQFTARPDRCAIHLAA
ncbi:hypothetical protein BN2475_340166 [Paraburkholderia ribeironis]|uniref:Uncharacterized protein n=1 Tax=Paraburkholderia ribeironis TaxID=1247936 RepID=A0A1N7S4H7_9BURK|nr:hypothetical protein [Paraburkholderia ribeironis]SIT42226.1 hypothetical protein BN2475_340166 [Paraburkholderia ribeironis]